MILHVTMTFSYNIKHLQNGIVSRHYAKQSLKIIFPLLKALCSLQYYARSPETLLTDTLNMYIYSHMLINTFCSHLT